MNNPQYTEYTSVITTNTTRIRTVDSHTPSTTVVRKGYAVAHEGDDVKYFILDDNQDEFIECSELPLKLMDDFNERRNR